MTNLDNDQDEHPFAILAKSMMKPLRQPRVKAIGVRPAKHSIWPNREAFISDVALFSLGAAGAFSIRLVGSLPGCEILLFPMLPVFLLARGKRAFNREYLWFYVLTAAWLLGTLIADLYNNINNYDHMKGVARVVFFALDFTALAILMNNNVRRLIIFSLSIGFVLYMGSREFIGEFSEQWKFGISQSLAICAFLVSCYYYGKKRYLICMLISVVMAGLNLVFGFRSQLLVVMVAAVLVLPIFDQKHSSSLLVKRIKVVSLLALAAVAAYGSNVSIRYAAEKGFFDDSTKQKFETQAQGDFGVLVGGRPETLVAIQAILDRPIIGHGSFPFEPKYLQLKQDIQYQHGYSDTDEPDENISGVIPTHSHLTMAWVESGILGGICWIYIIILVLRSLLQLSLSRPAMAPLYSYFMVSFIWDILYSPFGSVNRIFAAYFILLSYGVLKTSANDALLMRKQTMEYFARRRAPLPGAVGI